MFDFIFWVFTLVGAIITWEIYNMGLDWWGLAPSREWLKWGFDKEIRSNVYKWSFRLGPLQIFRM